MPQVTTVTVETIADTALIVRVVNFSATGTITIGTLILCDATSGAFTITLPVAGSQNGSRILIVKKVDNSVNAVTVSRAGSDTIDGATTVPLAAQYDSTVLGDDEAGGSWHVLATGV